MATSVTLAYTIDDAGLTFTGTGRVLGLPGDINMGDLANRDPIAFTAIQEWKSLNVTSGNVVVTAS